MCIMNKIYIAKNTLREQRIERLEIEASNINKCSCKFLVKAKIADTGIYEELTFVRNKMTLEEAE
jgi:hypothetical protein